MSAPERHNWYEQASLFNVPQWVVDKPIWWDSIYAQRDAPQAYVMSTDEARSTAARVVTQTVSVSPNGDNDLGYRRLLRRLGEVSPAAMQAQTAWARELTKGRHPSAKPARPRVLRPAFPTASTAPPDVIEMSPCELLVEMDSLLRAINWDHAYAEAADLLPTSMTQLDAEPKRLQDIRKFVLKLSRWSAELGVSSWLVA